MSFDGELLANVGYEIPYSGLSWQMIFWREQLVPTDYGYIYYNNRSNVPPASSLIDKSRVIGGSVAYLDKNFNLLRIRHFKHPGTTNDPWTFDDVSIMRSRHNTTYFATRSNKNYEQGHDDCYLYEFADDIDGVQEVVPVVHELHRGNYDFDFVAECRAVDVGDNFSLFFCYSLNVGASLGGDSWVVIEQLDHDFNTLREVYYSTDSDLMWSCAESITMTRDGGVLMTAHTKKLTDQSQQGSVVVKFPAEVFDGFDEAHDNGLKVAIAYPNPGKDVLNIRTGLQDAWVEVYDVKGRLVHRQDITENVTGIDATDWAEGVYVWKVYVSDGGPSTLRDASGTAGSGTAISTTLAETGKWIKE